MISIDVFEFTDDFIFMSIIVSLGEIIRYRPINRPQHICSIFSCVLKILINDHKHKHWQIQNLLEGN